VSRSVAVVIANDPGSGFTGPKYLETVGGRRLIDVVLADVATWPVDEAILVLGPGAEDVLDEMADTEATVVIDPEWEEGLAASLRVGLDVVMRGPGTDLVVVAYADQPGVTADTVGRLILEAAGATAVVPKYRYRRGWPIVLSAKAWERLLGLEGDVDLLDVLESHPGGVVEVWFDRLERPRIKAPTDIGAR